MPINGYIDLHVHTDNSDGSFSPCEILNLASDNNTKILAICDHDSIDGLDEFKNNIPFEMFGVKGVEFSSFIIHNSRRIKIHILGYCYDENNEKMIRLLYEMKQKRRKAHINLLQDLRTKIAKLPEKSISELNLDRYCWFDREVITCFEKEEFPPEVIDELRKVYKGIRFSYGLDYDIDARKVIDTIQSAGGYVVLAHPMSYKLDREAVFSVLKQLTIMGIDGVETYQSDCSYNDSVLLRKFVNENNLAYSIGSDFHRFINSDGRQISTGINNNLCIDNTSLTDKILMKEQYFKKK